MALGHGFYERGYGRIEKCLVHVFELVLSMWNSVHIVRRVVCLLMWHRMNIHCNTRVQITMRFVAGIDWQFPELGDLVSCAD